MATGGNDAGNDLGYCVGRNMSDIQTNDAVGGRVSDSDAINTNGAGGGRVTANSDVINTNDAGGGRVKKHK